MIDEIINSLGLSNSWLWIVALVLAVLTIILIITVCRQAGRIRRLEDRIDDFCQGSDGESLENDIADMFDENAEIRNHMDSVDAKIQNLYWRMKFSVQKVGVVKYNAFAQMGGDLSYAIAMLNENNDGFVMNCVHSADSCYTYTKIVKGGRADVDLGAEEAQAMKMALDNFNPNGKASTETAAEPSKD